jgi:membrane protein DedA with SNARE-associated domain
LDIASIIQDYGYIAVFIGAFLEGETILAMAGYAAFEGYLSLPRVIMLAATAGFLGDQFFFFLGRFRGRQILARFPGLQARAAKFDGMLARYHAPLIVLIRFMYGFRIAGPIFLGMGRVASWKFVVFNFIGACLWAPIVAIAGYVFGQAIEMFIQDSHRFQFAIFVAIAVAGAGMWWLHQRRK